MMRKLRIWLWILVLVFGLLMGYLVIKEKFENTSNSTAIGIGGPFSIASTNGVSLSDQDLLGKPWMLFFGFTYCPDVCPTTLYEMDGWFEALGKKAEDLRGILITVDPDRDSLDTLKQYISSFDGRIIALRPEPGELADLAKSFKIYYKKVPTGDDGDYTMDHTASVFLFDRNGDFFGTVDYHEDPEIAVKKLERLLAK